MKKLVILVLVLFSISMQGQVWIDTGATWHYKKEGLFPAFDKIEYIGDTIIQGRSCQKLQVSSYQFDYPEWGGGLSSTHISMEFTYASGDTVFYLVDDEFYTLYNFGAQVGDTWELGVDTNELMCGPSFVEVIGTGATEINGELYEWISVMTLPNSSVGFDGKIYKRFGPAGDYQYLFPTPRNCDPDIIVEFFHYTMTCFEDDSFPLYNTSDLDCEYLLHVGVSEIEHQESTVSLFPNPASDLLWIKMQGRYANISHAAISDTRGRLIKTEYQSEIDISDLPQGMYIIRIVFDNETVFTEKFLKN